MLVCCVLIFLRTYPAVLVCCVLIFLRTYPAVLLFFFALRYPAVPLLYFYFATQLHFIFAYPAVPLFFYALINYPALPLFFLRTYPVGMRRGYMTGGIGPRHHYAPAGIKRILIVVHANFEGRVLGCVREMSFSLSCLWTVVRCGLRDMEV